MYIKAKTSKICNLIYYSGKNYKFQLYTILEIMKLT